MKKHTQTRARWITATAASIMASAALVNTAHAQSSDALMDALVKKGILTEQEAEDIKADLYKENKETHKLKVNSGVKAFELFGDARLRYEYREAQTPASDTFGRSRFRYRLRFGIKGEYKDNWYYGMRLETSDSARSTNLTFGDASNKPYAKDKFGINVGQVYLGYNATDWLNVEAGKIANPLVTTSMVWDGDINPEGITERFKYDLVDERLNLFATLGQFIYDDRNPEEPVGAGIQVHDALLLAWQVGANYKINPDMSFQVAPVLYTYTGHGDAPLGGSFSGAPGGNASAINNLMVLEVPAEFNFKAAGLPMRFWADFAVNTQGGDRRDRAVGTGLVPAGTDDENIAYQIGFGVGKAKKKGTWEAKVFWQHAELFSLDPNLVDSDIYDSKLNMEGFAVGVGYALTDNIVANATYAYGDRINRDLGTLDGGDIGINPMNRYQLLQLDLSWKF